MKALQVYNNELKLNEVKLPAKKNETLVRVLKSGICNTDLEIVRGYAGFAGTIGHEFVGVVENSPDAPEMAGKRVVGEINAGCGVCEICLEGDSRHCPKRTVLGIVKRDGCHAEFLTLPSRNLFEVPEDISDNQAVFVEPLAAAYGITEQVKISSGMRVAVIGDGKLGILCAMCLSLKSDNVVLIGKHPEKLAAVKNYNVETILLNEIEKFYPVFDVAVEASGSESGFATALDLLKPRGKLVLKSTFQGKATWEAWRVVVNEITIVGSRCGRFAPAIKLLKTGKINVENLISEEFPLVNGIAAMNRAAEKGILKVLLKP